MRDGTVISEIKKLWTAIYSIAEGLKVVTISQALRDKATENLLIAKGIVTREELEAEVKKEAETMVAESQRQAAAASIVDPSGGKPSSIVLATPADMPPTPKL